MNKTVDRSFLVYFLFAGLVFHDFFAIDSFKFFGLTFTFLRLVLLLSIPALICLHYEVRNDDIIGMFFCLFIIYGLTRISGNYKQAFNLFCPLLAFFILYKIIDEPQLLWKCVDYVAILFIFFILLGIFELITGHHFVVTYLDELSDHSFNSHLAFGMYYNENDFSAFLTVTLFFLLLSSFPKVVKLSFSMLFITILLINGSVICLLGIASFLFISFVFYWKRYRFVRLFLATMVIRLMSSSIVDLIKTSSFSQRLYMYKYGIKNCLNHFMFGTGIGNYDKGLHAVGFVPVKYTSTNPHNLFLELAGQFGFIWSLLLLLLLVVLIIKISTSDIPKKTIILGFLYIVPFVGLSSSTCLEKNYVYLALLVPMLIYRFYCLNKKGTLIYLY